MSGGLFRPVTWASHLKAKAAEIRDRRPPLALCADSLAEAPQNKRVLGPYHRKSDGQERSRPMVPNTVDTGLEKNFRCCCSQGPLSTYPMPPLFSQLTSSSSDSCIGSFLMSLSSIFFSCLQVPLFLSFSLPALHPDLTLILSLVCLSRAPLPLSFLITSLHSRLVLPLNLVRSSLPASRD